MLVHVMILSSLMNVIVTSFIRESVRIVSWTWWWDGASQGGTITPVSSLPGDYFPGSFIKHQGRSGESQIHEPHPQIPILILLFYNLCIYLSYCFSPFLLLHSFILLGLEARVLVLVVLYFARSTHSVKGPELSSLSFSLFTRVLHSVRPAESSISFPVLVLCT